MAEWAIRSYDLLTILAMKCLILSTTRNPAKHLCIVADRSATNQILPAFKTCTRTSTSSLQCRAHFSVALLCHLVSIYIVYIKGIHELFTIIGTTHKFGTGKAHARYQNEHPFLCTYGNMKLPFRPWCPVYCSTIAYNTVFIGEVEARAVICFLHYLKGHSAKEFRTSGWWCMATMPQLIYPSSAWISLAFSPSNAQNGSLLKSQLSQLMLQFLLWCNSSAFWYCIVVHEIKGKLRSFWCVSCPMSPNVSMPIIETLRRPPVISRPFSYWELRGTQANGYVNPWPPNIQFFSNLWPQKLHTSQSRPLIPNII